MTKQSLILMSCAAVLLTACGGGGGNDDDVTDGIPNSALQSTENFTEFVAELSTEPEAETDLLEPFTAVPETLPTSETDEPQAIPE